MKEENEKSTGIDITQDTEEVDPAVLDKFNEASKMRDFDRKKVIAGMVFIIAIAYSAFHLWIQFNPLSTLKQRSIHVAVGLALIFLLFPAYRKQIRTRVPLYDWILFAFSFFTAIYIIVEYTEIVNVRSGIPNNIDIAVGILATILVLEAARRVTGPILPVVALLFLAYPFFSHMDFLPIKLMTRPFDMGDIFGQLFIKTEGLYSTAIGASVNYIFLFILFGAFLNKSGLGQFFNDIAMALAGGNKGGPAKVAVISSGFMGSINGAAVANVVSTGAFTIPLMKRVGYNKNFAGAVEASASVGGQVLPPIMGASAFIMAETTGINYGVIALAALIPALLYYFAVIMQVHYRAGKQHLHGVPKADLPKVKEVMKARGHLVIPIIVLIVLLFKNMPVGHAAFWTIVSTVVIAALKKNTRMSVKDILDAMALGARQALTVIIACAVVGIIIGVVSLTSLGTVMTSSIQSIGAGSLFLTLFFTMVASMILGMGLPSIPAYIITATMTAPALAEFGVPILIAHMFVFYFGIFANVTPPVALAAFAGAGISGGNPMYTGFQALKLSLAGFIIPYLFVYEPSLLLIDPTGLATNAKEFPLPPFGDVIVSVGTAIIGIIALSAALEGYFRTKIHMVLRILLFGAALFSVMPGLTSDIIGLFVIAVIFLLNYVKDKKQNVGVKAA